jgi:Skp family chaperone for outer membrane proteins
MKNMSRKMMLTLLSIVIASTLSAQSSFGKKNIAIINSESFQDPKTGVTKLIAVQKSLETLFKPRQDELTRMQTTFNTLVKQIKNDNSQSDNLKRDEAEKLQRDVKFKTEQFQMDYNKRYQEIMRPLQLSIFSQIKNWCKEKGITALIDISKDEKGLILWFEEEEITATNADLVRYLNASMQ